MTTLTTVFAEIGFIRWPMLFALGAMALLTVVSTVRLMDSSGASSLRTKAWIDGVLFWGGFSAVAGVLGSLIGIIVAAQAIERVGEVQTHLVAGGFKVALLSSSLGLLTLMAGSLIWYGLSLRWKMLVATEAEMAAVS